MHSKNIKYIIGVDGGGSGTRVTIADLKLNPLAKAEGAPSALGQGIEQAWRSIMDTIAQAFSHEHIKVPMLQECAIGLGLSGANNIIWKNEFLLRNPGFKVIAVECGIGAGRVAPVDKDIGIQVRTLDRSNLDAEPIGAVVVEYQCLRGISSQSNSACGHGATPE